MKKKIICLSLAVLTTLMAASCGSKQGSTVEPTTGTIKVTAVDLGYGVKWLEEIIDAYEQDNPGCYVDFESTVDGSALASKIRTTANDNDLVVSTGAFFTSQADGYLYDVSEIFTTTQDGWDAPLIDRMNKSISDYYRASDGKFYQIPWVFGYNGILYNKTVLDYTFGEDNYELPKTTDEMTDFCQSILNKQKGVVPFSLSTEVPYWQSVLVGMYFQYQGEEEYNKFYEGYYKKDGAFVKATKDNYSEYLNSQTGVLKSAEVVYEWLGEKGFAHKSSAHMNYQQAQNVFCGLGYGADMTKAAFMVCGDWFHNEMADSIAKAEETQGGCDIRVMKVPVISSIVERLENKNLTDAQLSEIIAAIDAGATSYDGVSENDFKTLVKARYSSTSTATSHVMVIPKMKKTRHYYGLTKQFINYMMSMAGQELFSYTLNGLAMPYGYEPTGIYGPYADSILENFGNRRDFTVITEGHNSPLHYIGGMDIIVGYYEKEAFNQSKNAQAYFESCVTASYNNRNKVLPLIK